MKGWWRFAAIGVLAAGMMLVLGPARAWRSRVRTFTCCAG